MRQAGTLQGRGHLAPLTVITKPPEKKSRLTRKEQQKIIADLKATVAANERELSRAAAERRSPSFTFNSSGLFVLLFILVNYCNCSRKRIASEW